MTDVGCVPTSCSLHKQESLFRRTGTQHRLYARFRYDSLNRTLTRHRTTSVADTSAARANNSNKRHTTNEQTGRGRGRGRGSRDGTSLETLDSRKLPALSGGLHGDMLG